MRAVCKMAKGGEPLEFTRLATGHVFVIRGSIPNWVAAPATSMSHDWWLVAAGSLILAGNVSACGWVPGGWQYTVRNHWFIWQIYVFCSPFHFSSGNNIYIFYCTSVHLYTLFFYTTFYEVIWNVLNSELKVTGCTKAAVIHQSGSQPFEHFLINLP